MFPEQWSSFIICPLYKKGLQCDPAIYRPVCLFSHVRNTVDTAVLMILNEQFTPSESQFGFQVGVTITQALLQDEDNAGTGMMRHAAVLDR